MQRSGAFCAYCGASEKRHTHALTLAKEGSVCVNSGERANVHSHGQNWTLAQYMLTQALQSCKALVLCKPTADYNRSALSTKARNDLRAALFIIVDYVDVYCGADSAPSMRQTIANVDKALMESAPSKGKAQGKT
jgi:hypothetical protein